MDPKQQPSKVEPGRVFTEEEYYADVPGVIAYAFATGLAIVVGPDGRQRVAISTRDLPDPDAID